MEVHFTPELERKLSDLAVRRGQGTEELVQKFVAERVDELSRLEVFGGHGQPLQNAADIILDRMRNLPPGIMAALPKDGASQHDHYIYGWPKRAVMKGG